MTPDQELTLIFGALHLVALMLGGVLFVMFLRSEATKGHRDPEDDDSSEGGGGGGNDRNQPRPARPRPGGGLPVPLPDAVPARVRLRGHGRLAEAHPPRERRPAREPVRVPTRR